MTHYEYLCLLVANKDRSYDVPKLPPANPDNFIVWTEGEFEKVMAEEEKRTQTDPISKP